MFFFFFFDKGKNQDMAQYESVSEAVSNLRCDMSVSEGWNKKLEDDLADRK